MSDDIIDTRNNLFKSLERHIENIIQHISANTLNEEDFANLTKIIGTFYSLEDFMKKVYSENIKDSDFKLERQYLNNFTQEATGLRSLWKNHTSVELGTILRLRAYTRGLKDAIRRVHEKVGR